MKWGNLPVPTTLGPQSHELSHCLSEETLLRNLHFCTYTILAAISGDLLFMVLSLGVKSSGLATTNHILSGCLHCTRLLNTRILQFRVSFASKFLALFIFSFICSVIHFKNKFLCLRGARHGDAAVNPTNTVCPHGASSLADASTALSQTSPRLKKKFN